MMENFIKKVGGPKIAILMAVALAIVLIAGLSVSANHGHHGNDPEHGHEH